MRRAALLLLILPACTKWVPNDKPLPVAPSYEFDTARLHLTDRRMVTLSWPHIRGDSIAGKGRDGVFMVVARSDVTSVERKRTNVAATAALVGAAALAAGGVAAGIALENMSYHRLDRQRPAIP